MNCLRDNGVLFLPVGKSDMEPQIAEFHPVQVAQRGGNGKTGRGSGPFPWVMVEC